MHMRLILGLVLVGTLAGCSAQLEPTAVLIQSVDLTKPSQSPETSTSDLTEPQLPTDFEAEIEIEDQVGSGALIAVEEISVQRGNAFLVITDSDGEVIASELVTPRSQPVNVVLTKRLVASATLEASLHLDDGDGLFDPRLDLLIVGEEGDSVTEDFYYEVSD